MRLTVTSYWGAISGYSDVPYEVLVGLDSNQPMHLRLC